MPSHQLSSVSDRGWTYCFEKPLGSGGFATVYRATMSSGEVVRRVAVKVLQLSAAVDTEAVARLRDEARILSRLEHPAIVRVLGTIEVTGSPAVVMELVDGIDLRRLLKSAPLPARAVCEIGAEVAGALDAAWNDPDPQTGLPLRIIHRDIKPANLLLSRHGAVKLVDFGVARAAIERDGTTRSVVQLGTERYMAPERFDHLTTPASDIYALGMSLIEMMVGRSATRLPVRPQQYKEAVQQLLKAVWETGGAPHWTIELVALLEDMLRYEEVRRPTASEVAERLLELSDEAPGQGLRRVGPALVQAGLAARDSPPVAAGILDMPTAVSAPSTSSPSPPSLSSPPPPSDPPPAAVPFEPPSMELDPASPGHPVDRRSSARPAVVALLIGVLGVGGGLVWQLRTPPPSAAVIEPAAVEPTPVHEPPLAQPVGAPSPEAEPAPAVEPESSAAPAVRSASPDPAAVPAPTETAARIPVHFSLSVGSGGEVEVDKVRFTLPATVPLTPGLHAVTFAHRGDKKSQMVYVGEGSPRRHVYDSSSGVVHSFK